MINKNKFSEVMARRTDDELFKIITIDRENYEADAIQAAENEIENRNIDLQDATNIKEKYDNQSAEQIIECQKTEHAKSKRVSLFARMQNFAIDTLVIFFSFYIFLLVFEYLNLPMLDIISLIFLICTFFSYYIFFEYKYQKTLGKILTKTKVVKQNGEKAELNDIIYRTVYRLIPFDRLSYVFMKNGIHDELSKTMVISEK